jgi:hypothetical protein
MIENASKSTTETGQTTTLRGNKVSCRVKLVKREHDFCHRASQLKFQETVANQSTSRGPP